MTESSGGSRYEPGTGSTDASGTGGYSGGDAPAGGPESGRGTGGREWLGQLQSMIDNVATQASPILRDIAAKAAELAAAAGDKAGPIAHKAAEATEAAGTKLAERGREVAAELRRDQGAGGAGAAAGDEPNGIDPGPGATTDPANRRPGAVADSADSLGE